MALDHVREEGLLRSHPVEGRGLGSQLGRSRLHRPDGLRLSSYTGGISDRHNLPSFCTYRDEGMERGQNQVT